MPISTSGITTPHNIPGLPAVSPLVRNFLPADLAVELEKCDLDGCIAVQARQSLEETRWLLELADQTSMIKGVVGWVDLRSPQVERQLEEFSHHEKLVGVRHVVQDEVDDNFYARPSIPRWHTCARTVRLNV